MITVTVDTSPASHAAIPVAVDLARRFGTRLQLLLVIDGPLRHHFDEIARRSNRTPAAAAQDHLDEIAAPLRADGVAVDTAWRHGVDAGTEIVAATSGGDVALLVIATHGRSGLSRWLTGSVTEHVIRNSPVPVVVVPAYPRHATRNGTDPADQPRPGTAVLQET